MTSKIDKVRAIINFLVSYFLQNWAGNLIKLFTCFNVFAFVRAVCCAIPNGYMVWWYMLAMILNSWWTLVWFKINSFSLLILISVLFTVCHTFPVMTVLRIWGLLTNNALQLIFYLNTNLTLHWYCGENDLLLINLKIGRSSTL